MNIKTSDLKIIANKVKTKKCVEHRKTATVVIKNRNIELSNFCCEDFNEKLHEITKNLVIKQVMEYEKENIKKNTWKKFS